MPTRHMRLFVVVVLLILCKNAWAQSSYQDVIYLKNGGTVRGELIRIDNGILLIRTHGESRVELPMSDVERIAKEPRNTLETDSIKPRFFKSEGITVFQEIGYGYSTGMLRTSRGSFNYRSQSYTFMGGVGVYIADYVILAAGTGYGQLSPDRKIVPLFGEIRTHLMRRQFSPYLLLRGGYSIGWRDNLPGNDWGGALFEAAAGIKTYLTPQYAIYAHGGYHQQQQRIELINLATRNVFSEKANYQFWGIRIGVLF
ncbi:hypothetical protein [Rhodoflexus caldus]|uniref:hypothetical protein n=1 Tax=Rhodoflexus caldus TaxID=2891236 RepID=UPI00202A7A6A|nr:hypothetical protein [Rhodoflexus caldus]